MKNKLLLLFFLISCFSFAQIGIGTLLPAGALDITSTTSGILIPRFALTSKAISAPVVHPGTGLSPANGTLIFNTATTVLGTFNDVVPGFYFWNGTSWVFVGNDPKSATGAWSLLGNNFTNPVNNFIGTIDNQDLVFKTANVQTGRINKDGLSISLGLGAGLSGSSLNNTLFIGNAAGASATNANYSNFMGTNAGRNATNADNSNFFGSFSGIDATNANRSNFLGLDAGRNATNADNSNFFGSFAGSGATDARFSNFVGLVAGRGAINANDSNFFGSFAGDGAANASQSNFFGVNAGTNSINARFSNFFGGNAGSNAINASESNFFGPGAGQNATNASRSNFFGNTAGQSAQNARNSIFIGDNTGLGAVNANNSIFIGNRAGGLDTVNNASPASGTSILIGDDSSTGGFSNSIALGKSAINTKINQFLLGPSYINLNFRGVDYELPSVQGATGTVLANNGAGVLSWSTGALNNWSLLGNTGTNPATNFIGTIDAQDLVFRTANVQTGRINKNGLSFSIGLNAGIGGSIIKTNFIGTESGFNATNAQRSNFIGETAGYEATNAYNSNFIGENAGLNGINSFNSNFIGSNSGRDANNAGYSNFVGLDAGRNATSAQSSNFIGYFAGKGATNANSSNFIGLNAGFGAINANNSIFIGKDAGLNDTINNTITASSTSILIGDNTNTGGFSNSIAIGNAAVNTKINQFLLSPSYINMKLRGVDYELPSAQGATGTILVNNGAGVLSWSIGSPNNWGILGNTGTNPTNNFIGTTDAQDLVFKTANVQTGRINKDGLSISLGLGAGSGGASLLNTLFIGNAAGASATNAFNSNFIGQNAGQLAAEANNSNFIGTAAGSQATNANKSNFIGTEAGSGAVDAVKSNFIGASAGFGAINAFESNFFGDGAGGLALTANNSNFLGTSAGSNAPLASNSNFSGNQAGFEATNANNSNFFGQNAGQAATEANNSNFIGTAAGLSATSASLSNFIGLNAGNGATAASNTNFIGNETGRDAANASFSNFIGVNAGKGATNANNSIFIGNNAGYDTNTSNGDIVNNTTPAFGTSILIGDDTSTGGFSNSIAIGKSAINTKINQFLLSPTYINLNLRGVDYELPSAQGATGTVLANDGSGGLSWASTVSNVINGLTTTSSTTKLGGSLVNDTTISQAGFDFNLLGGKFEQRYTMPVDGSISGITNSTNGFGGYPEESLSLFNVDSYPIQGLANERMSRVFVTKGNAGISANGTAGSGGVIYAEESGGVYMRSFFTGNNTFDFYSNTAGSGIIDVRTPTKKAKASFDANLDEILFETGQGNQTNFSISKANGLLLTKNGPTKFSVNNDGDMFLGRSLSLSGTGAGTTGQVLTSAGSGVVPTWTSPSATVWGLTGNTGTNPANNFIGTTDLKDLVFRTHGIERGKFDTAKDGQLILTGGGVNARRLLLQSSTANNYIQFSGSAGAVTIGASGKNFFAFDDASSTFFSETQFTSGSITRDFLRSNGNTIHTDWSSALGTTRLGINTVGDYFIYDDDATTYRMVINNLGNVSFGGTTPTEKLDVIGNVKFSGAIMPNNLAGTTGQVLTSAGGGNAPTWTTPQPVGAQSYQTANTSGTFNVPLTAYTVRVFGTPSSVVLPTPIGNNGKIFIIIGSNGISSIGFTSVIGDIYDDVTNTTITTIAGSQRYMVQSDGTNWIVIGR